MKQKLIKEVEKESKNSYGFFLDRTEEYRLKLTLIEILVVIMEGRAIWG